MGMSKRELYIDPDRLAAGGGVSGGTGDVIGPGTAADGNFSAFDTNTGKLIKDSGSKAADFAAASHDHSGTYSPTSHNHDLAYAGINHHHVIKTLNNMVLNGDLRAGITGWAVIAASQSVTNKILATLATSITGGSNNGLKTIWNGHHYYVSAMVKADNPNVRLALANSDSPWQTLLEIYHSGGNTFERLSGIYDSTVSFASCRYKVDDIRSSGYTTFYSYNHLMVDLTETFGSGNEPTKSEMDAIMSTYFINSWFNEFGSYI